MSHGPAWWSSLIYLDRYRNEGTRTYSPHAGYSEAREPYRPTSTHESFELPVVELPVERMKVYMSDPAPTVAARYLQGDTISFCVHPQLLEDLPYDRYLRRSLTMGQRRAPLHVSPTSSTRTLVVHAEGPPHAVKVHFPFRVSRYTRRMRDEVIEQAVALSRAVEGSLGELDSDFGFLREVIGVSHENLEPGTARCENWGYLVREMTPFPAPEGEIRLVPGFALYGDDRFDLEAPPLLFELFAGHPGAAAGSILETLFLPVIRHWVRLYRRLGLVLEPHGQNTLLELDGGGRARRIVHRDLSLGIDMRVRRDRGLSSDALNDYNRLESGDFASIAYDKFLGAHFFDRVVALLAQDDPRVSPDTLRGACREEFARLFPEHRSYLPATVRYFSEERDEFGKPLFCDTGEAPVWRP